MCNPVALVAVSMVMTAVGTMQQYSAAQDQAKYAKEVGKMNAEINQRAEKDAIKRGEREERLHALTVQREKSSKRSSLAAGGFDVNFGSSLVAQADVQAMGDIESGTIRSNAHREAYNIRVQGVRQQAQADADVSAAKNRATSSLISGATSLAKTGASFGQAGGFGSFGSPAAGSSAAQIRANQLR